MTVKYDNSEPPAGSVSFLHEPSDPPRQYVNITMPVEDYNRLRQNSERWEWVVRSGLRPSTEPYPHFELALELKQFAYREHIEGYIDAAIATEKEGASNA